MRFPFTDLSTRKERPALVVSPNWFNHCYQDRVLIGITSSTSGNITERRNITIDIEPDDMKEGRIYKRSIVKLTKIFTCSEDIIIRKVAHLKEEKLSEVLEKLRDFFSEQTTG